MKFCIWKKYILATVYGILFVFDQQTSEIISEVQLNVGEVTELYGIENAIYIVSGSKLRQFILQQLNNYDYKLDMVMETDLQMDVNYSIFTRSQLLFFDIKQHFLKVFNRNKSEQIYQLPEDVISAIKSKNLVFFNKSLIYAKDNLVKKYSLEKQQEYDFEKLREPIISMCTTAQYLLIATVTEGRIYDFQGIQVVINLQIQPEKVFLQAVTPEYICATAYCSRSRRVDVFRWFTGVSQVGKDSKNDQTNESQKTKRQDNSNNAPLVIKKPVVRLKLNNQGFFTIMITKAQPGAFSASIIQQYQLLPKIQKINWTGGSDEIIQQNDTEIPLNAISLDEIKTQRVSETLSVEIGLKKRVWGENIEVATGKLNAIEQSLRTGDVASLKQLILNAEFTQFEELNETLKTQFIRFILMHSFNPKGIQWLITFKDHETVQQYKDEIFLRLKQIQKAFNVISDAKIGSEAKTQVSDLEPLVIIDAW